VTLLSPAHAGQLLEGVILREVFECISREKLHALEAWLAIELGRIGVTEAEMVLVSRDLISRALHHIADRGWHPWDADRELDDRYAQGLCRS
jgi:hypothetical protein